MKQRRWLAVVGWWALALGLVYLLNTPRHELMHLIAAKLHGADVTAFHPGPLGGGHTDWNWTSLSYQWFPVGAPFMSDGAMGGAAWLIAWRVRPIATWSWAHLIALGFVMPVYDLASNYAAAGQAKSDVNRLFDTLPGNVVHAWLAGTIVLCVIGLIAAVWWRRQARPVASN